MKKENPLLYRWITSGVSRDASDSEFQLLTKTLIASQGQTIVEAKQIIQDSKQPPTTEQFKTLGKILGDHIKENGDIYCGLGAIGIGLFLTPLGTAEIAMASFSALSLLWKKIPEWMPAGSYKTEKYKVEQVLIAAACHHYQHDSNFRKLFSSIAKDANLTINLDMSAVELASKLPTSTRELVGAVLEEDFSSKSDSQNLKAILEEYLPFFNEQIEAARSLNQAEKTYQEKCQKIEKIEREHMEIEGAITVASLFLDRVLVKPELAKKLGTVASSLQNVNRAYQLYKVGRIGICALSGNLATSIVAIIDIFGGKSQQQVVVDYLASIQKAISVMYENMIKGFKHISQQQIEILKRMELLLQEQENLRQGMIDIQKDINSMRTEMNDGFRDLSLEKSHSAFDNIQSSILRKQFSLSGFYYNDLGTIYSHGTFVATTSSFTGGAGLTKQQLIDAFGQRRSLEYVLNLLQQVAMYLQIPFGDIIGSDSIANPIEWARATQMFIASLYDPVAAQKPDIQSKLKSLYQVGLYILQITNIFSDYKIVLFIAQQYRAMAATFIAKIKKEIQVIGPLIQDGKFTETQRASFLQTMRAKYPNEIVNIDLAAIALCVAAQINMLRTMGAHIDDFYILQFDTRLFSSAILDLTGSILFSLHKDIDFEKIIDKKLTEHVENSASVLASAVLEICPEKGLPLVEQSLLLISSYVSVYVSELVLGKPEFKLSLPELVPTVILKEKTYAEIFNEYSNIPKPVRNKLIAIFESEPESIDLFDELSPIFLETYKFFGDHRSSFYQQECKCREVVKDVFSSIFDALYINHSVKSVNLIFLVLQQRYTRMCPNAYRNFEDVSYFFEHKFTLGYEESRASVSIDYTTGKKLIKEGRTYPVAGTLRDYVHKRIVESGVGNCNRKETVSIFFNLGCLREEVFYRPSSTDQYRDEESLATKIERLDEENRQLKKEVATIKDLLIFSLNKAPQSRRQPSGKREDFNSQEEISVFRGQGLFSRQDRSKTEEPKAASLEQSETYKPG